MSRPLECNEKCGRYKLDLRSPCLPGVGIKPSAFMIVGDYPGQIEDKTGEAFVGAAGNLLDDALRKVGLSREHVYITNAVKCSHPANDKRPTPTEAKYCRAHLIKEIQEVNPNVILSLGNVALTSLLDRTGITKHKNSVYLQEDAGCKVVPTYHPAYVLRNPGEMNQMLVGFEMARSEANTKDFIKDKKATGRYVLAKTPERITQIFAALANVPEYSLDLETSSLDLLDPGILSVQVSWQEGTGVTIPWEVIKENPSLVEQFQQLLSLPNLKNGQNLKFDIERLLIEGFVVHPPYFDTIIAHSLIDDNAPDHKLGSLVLQYTDMGEYWAPLDNFKDKYCKENKIKKEDFSYAWLPRQMLYKYGAQDADATLRLKKIFLDRMHQTGVLDFFNRYSIPFMPVLVEMEVKGIKVDRELIKKQIVIAEKELKEKDVVLHSDPTVQQYALVRVEQQRAKLRTRRLESVTLVSRFPDPEEYVNQFVDKPGYIDKRKVNLNSPDQLKELFFDVIKAPVISRTDKGAPKTDKATLEILADEYGIDLAIKLMARRKISHHLSNFANPMYEKSKKDGRIHTDYVQHDVTTGRLSSRNPNMQNLPRDNMEFKRCFLADEGYNFVKADLAQVEFRVWAHCSNDQDMLQDIAAGLDIHSLVASEVFGIPIDNLIKSSPVYKENADYRQAAKGGTFGMMYGIGIKTLARNFKITLEQASRIGQVFASRYPMADMWLKRIVQEAHLNGYVSSWLGRIRRLPAISAEDHNAVAYAERQARNSPIQSAASDMNNHFMVCNVAQARAAGIDCYPAMTTHDENVMQAREGHEINLMHVMKHVVETEFPDFKCKMELEFKVGKTLGDAKEVVI